MVERCGKKDKRGRVRFFAAALFWVLCIAVVAALAAPGAEAATSGADARLAREIAQKLGEEFGPEKLSVTVRDSFVYAEAIGAVISNIRIDTMRLEGLLKRDPQGNNAAASGDVRDLATLITYSKGEIVLTEKDVNDYFAKNEKGGFSNLRFDFLQGGGFRATAVFTASFLFTLRIKLSAEGDLALRPDGVYLDKTAIFVESVRQTDYLTNKIIERVNPLLEFSKIPFPVEFKRIEITDTSALMTGNPKRFSGGATTEWKRP